MHPQVQTLFEDEFEAMVGLARLLLDNGSDVEDVVMDAFVATAERIVTLDRPGAYLRTAVVNGCRQRHRDGRRRWRILGERVAPAVRRRDTPDIGAPLEMWGFLEELSERERQALVLTYYLDLPHAETASILGCSSGTVKSLVHRAKGSMRELMVP